MSQTSITHELFTQKFWCLFLHRCIFYLLQIVFKQRSRNLFIWWFLLQTIFEVDSSITERILFWFFKTFIFSEFSVRMYWARLSNCLILYFKEQRFWTLLTLDSNSWTARAYCYLKLRLSFNPAFITSLCRCLRVQGQWSKLIIATVWWLFTCSINQY